MVSLLDLPNELLSNVIDQLMVEGSIHWRCKNEFPTLKALRLTCRHLASFAKVLEYLFFGIRLIATQEKVHNLETLDIARIVPHVRRLTFLPSTFSWDMTYAQYEEIMFCQAVHGYASAHNISGSVFYEDRIDGYQQFMKEHWNGRRPFSNEELRRGYEEYMSDANDARALIKGDRLRKAWVETLTKLSKCAQFRVGYWEFEGREMPEQPQLRIIPHRHEMIHREEVCRRIAARPGDALCAAAFQCLADAKTQPTQLDLKYISTGVFQWTSLPEWDRLDLSHMKTLFFRPRVQEISENTSDEDIARNVGDALTLLLSRTRESLETLEHNGGVCFFSIEFPQPGAIVPLPQLRRLVAGPSVSLGAFADFITAASKLEFLALPGTSGHGPGTWRDLWDAIRDHPSRMQLEIDQIPCNDCAEVSLSHHTLKESDEEKDRDPWMDSSRSLANYVSGVGHWNRSLKVWFDNWGEGDDSDSDDDWDVSD